MLFSEIGFCIITIDQPDFEGPRESLELNNYKLSLTPFGNYFRDYFGNYLPMFFVPSNSQLSTIRDSYLVLGGTRVGKDGIATTNNNHPDFGYISDFWPGPVSDPYGVTSEDDQQWKTLWKVSREEIEEHIHHFQDPGYEIPEGILSWPAHGDTSKRQSDILAWFVDRNQNGRYEPEEGDYPWVPGDAAVFSLYNDMRLRNNASEGHQLGVEVHQTAYVWDCSEDSALYNTIFVNYRIINRWEWLYDEFYVGIITEFGIGSHHDDYYGCDTALNAYFAYNDSIDDAFNEIPVYGTSPPAQAICFLNHTLHSFVRHDNINYWNVMNNLQGLWSNGLPVFYGGTGTNGTDTTLFLYSADPNDPEGWSEIQTNPLLNGYKKGHGSIGPFSFYMGDTIELDIAFVFARDYGGTNLSSVDLLKERIARVRWYYENDTLPCGKHWSEMTNTKKAINFFQIYPNPFTDFLTISAQHGDKQNFVCGLFSLDGRAILKEQSRTGKINLSLGNLSPGIYILHVKDEFSVSSFKIVKK
jgi:hypothetical protein